MYLDINCFRFQYVLSSLYLVDGSNGVFLCFGLSFWIYLGPFWVHPWKTFARKLHFLLLQVICKRLPRQRSRKIKNGLFVEANNLIWVLLRNPSSMSEHQKEGSPLVGNTKFSWYQLFIYGIILLDQCFLFANNQYVYKIMKFLDPTAKFHVDFVCLLCVSAFFSCLLKMEGHLECFQG